MEKETRIKKIKKDIRPFLIFLFAGIVFVLVAKASMNFELFVSEIFSVILIESIFLIFSFLSLRFFFLKMKNIVLSYLLYYFSLGLFGLIFIEYFLNKNSEFGFPVLLFLFLLKSLEASVARLVIDISIEQKLRESFLKHLLISYFLYISVSSFAFFALQSKLIWNFAFIVLIVVLTIFFYIFLYRIKRPKKEKAEKPLFDDVAFY